jgi:predicted phosphodiesterase
LVLALSEISDSYVGNGRSKKRYDMEPAKNYSVHGGKILVFGDLHLSSTYEGQHVNYLEESLYNIWKIRDMVLVEKPSAVMFLGDLIGVRERNIKDRRFFREVLLFFKTLTEVTGGNVYSVKGNHDFGDYSDFDLLIGLGYLKNPTYVDYMSDSGLEVRFHFVNYGYERKPLVFPKESECSNVVLCHADIQIPGVTTWYTTKDGIQLSSLKNWCGVDLVVAGHIHTPSKEISFTTINDASTGLFYPGSPSRVAERYNDCWYMEFSYNEEVHTTDYQSNLFGLKDVSEVFYPKEDFIDDGEISEEEIRTQSLTNIVREVMEGRMTSGDLFQQIRVIPGASDRVKDIACEYLQRAIDEVKNTSK